MPKKDTVLLSEVYGCLLDAEAAGGMSMDAEEAIHFAIEAIETAHPEFKE